MARDIQEITPISEAALADPELQKTRHRGMPEWDDAIIGTAKTEQGHTVFVYNDQELISLVAEQLRISGEYEDDSDLYDAATETVFADSSDYLMYEKGKCRPYILTEAPEEPEFYEEEETLFRLGATLYH